MPSRKPQQPSVPDNPFVGHPHAPRHTELREALGRSAAAWEALKRDISQEFSGVTEEWAVPAKVYGWSFRLKLKKRTIVHMGPRHRHFVAGLILGEKAVDAVRTSGLPSDIVTLVESAPKYPEGRGLRFEIRTKKDLEAVEALARIKMAN